MAKCRSDIAIQKCVSAVLFIERILWFIVDILILLIVEAVCIKQAVTVGGNARLISGKRIENTEDFRVGFGFGKDLQTYC
jgi:hypothetical protein